jgi:hypothetical protein
MSYDSSHRQRPPRQERWPQATPAEGWQAYRQDDVQTGADSYWAAAGVGGRGQLGHRDAAGGSAPDRGYRGHQPPRTPDRFAETPGGYQGSPDETTGSFPASGTRYAGHQNGYDQGGRGYHDAGPGYEEAQDGFDGAPVGYHARGTGYGRTTNGYGGARNGYGGALDGYGGDPYGYGGAPDDFAGSAGDLSRGDYAEPDYREPDYREPDHSGPRRSGSVLAAPDVGVYPDSWQADQELRREAGRRGLMVGAVTGFLAAAAAIGVSTLAAAFVGRQAAPVIVVGDALVNWMPPTLKNVAVAHFGKNGQTLLLLGVYVAITFLAIAVGLLARRAAALGVAGLATLGLCCAFVVITRPGGRLTDVIPSVFGGLAGIAALLWLVRASAPVAPLRPTRGGGSRRAR